MNVYLNKEFLKFRKINNRYLKFNDKSEKQMNINDNFNNFTKPNVTKPNYIYNSNFFSNNKIGKNSFKNYNNIKKDGNLKLNPIVNSQKIDNNLKLCITNFKNVNANGVISSQKNININKDKEENKLNNIFVKKNDSIPTIAKIQKLIEALQSRHTIENNSINNKNKYSFDNKNNNSIKNIENYNYIKKDEKLPSLINGIKTSFKHPQNNSVKEQILFPINDTVNRVNHTKIKLKNLNHDPHLTIKNYLKNKEEKSNNIKSIQIKAKNLPQPKPRKPKVSLNQVKNILKDDLIINNNGCYEKIVNIRLKTDNINSRNYFNESAYQNNSLSLMKTKKDSVNFCLSNYSNYQNNLMVLKQTFHNLENERTRKEKFFNKNQTMFKNPLNDKKLKEENEEDENDGEDDSKGFSKYFLPSSGFGLLERHDN
jgi:hypothetical protein